MRKRFWTAAAAAIMAAAMSLTAYAGAWKQDGVGWWWQNDDGSYPVSCWQWLDGNGDGIAESYCFDANGYMYANTTTPDGYTVNADGAWTVNGVVQTQTQTVPQGQTQGDEQAVCRTLTANIRAIISELDSVTRQQILDEFGFLSVENLNEYLVEYEEKCDTRTLRNLYDDILDRRHSLLGY